MAMSPHSRQVNDEIRRKKRTADQQSGRTDPPATRGTESGAQSEFDYAGRASEMETDHRPDQDSGITNRRGLDDQTRQEKEAQGIQPDAGSEREDIIRQYEKIIPARELTKKEKRASKWAGRGGSLMNWITRKKAKQPKDENVMLDANATTQPPIKIETEATKPFSHTIALKSGGKLAFISGATIIAILAAIRGFAPQYAITQTEQEDAQVADAIQQLLAGIQQIVEILGVLTPIAALLYGYVMNVFKNKHRPKA